jgi:hypothetical protein
LSLLTGDFAAIFAMFVTPGWYWENDLSKAAD